MGTSYDIPILLYYIYMYCIMMYHIYIYVSQSFRHYIPVVNTVSCFYSHLSVNVFLVLPWGLGVFEQTVSHAKTSRASGKPKLGASTESSNRGKNWKPVIFCHGKELDEDEWQIRKTSYFQFSKILCHTEIIGSWIPKHGDASIGMRKQKHSLFHQPTQHRTKWILATMTLNIT